MKRPALRLPTILANRYVRYAVGFGVAVPIGLAPLLGKYRVKGFEPLLSLFPEASKTFLIATSAFLMGIVAVVIQFYAGESIARHEIRKRFKRSTVAILVALFALVTLYSLRVLRVRDPVTARYEPVILGWWRVSEEAGCGCTTDDDLECADGLGYSDLGSCWPHRGQVELSLQLLYLVLTGGLGALIGLVLLQEEARRQAAKEATRRNKTKVKRRRRPVARSTKEAVPTPENASGPDGAVAPLE